MTVLHPAKPDSSLPMLAPHAPSRSLVGLSLVELRHWVAARDLPAFRAAQIYHGLYHRLALSPESLTDLPLAVRDLLAAEASFGELSVARKVSDVPSRTTKTLFALRDGALVESVLMRYVDADGHRRHTVCLSSQVGCALGCTFCATGAMGWARDLSAGEMIEQVLYFARLLQQEDQHITNIVYMGMGEPFLNFDAVLQSVAILTDPAGFGLGSRHVTISTSGVVPAIERFTGLNLQVGLAVSLHASNDALRSRLVPLNRRYPLADLMRACRAYTERSHRRVSFEYTMLEGVNDQPEQAVELARLLRGMLTHVNLIPWNYVEGMAFRPAGREAIVDFRDTLASYGIPATIRDTRGARISAACGQLRTATVRSAREARADRA
jgi:23S rRNA (adenine2503-C2)-methyltransferase